MSTATIICGFPPIASANANILILGSMPGTRSLEEQQYYAHPQNLFWRFMGELIGAGRELSYEQRLERLIDHQIALWDVMHTCERHGSLDSNIIDASIEPNDFAGFFEKHPHIRKVFFNGSKAEHAFNRYVKKHLSLTQHITFTRLPSTSPANASISIEQKRTLWEQVVSPSSL